MKSILGRRRLFGSIFVMLLILVGYQTPPASFAISVTPATPAASSATIQDTEQDTDTTQSGNGLVTVASDATVAETADRLEAALEEQGLTVFGVVDHAANVEQAELELRPTRLILVGNPRLGTPLMQENQTAAIDLPQKFLVWEDAQGDVFITYNDPHYLADRHDLSGQEEVLETITNALGNFAEGAASENDEESAAQPQDEDTEDEDTEDENGEMAGYPNGQLLVDTEWLAEHLDDPNLRIVDIRSTQSYATAHIPNAVNVPLNAIVATVNGIPFEFDQDKVQETLNQLGLTPEMTVVIYDDLGMMNAARLFWTLEYVGHSDARMLNGDGTLGWRTSVQLVPRPQRSKQLTIRSLSSPTC